MPLGVSDGSYSEIRMPRAWEPLWFRKNTLWKVIEALYSWDGLSSVLLQCLCVFMLVWGILWKGSDSFSWLYIGNCFRVLFKQGPLLAWIRSEKDRRLGSRVQVHCGFMDMAMTRPSCLAQFLFFFKVRDSELGHLALKGLWDELSSFQCNSY